MSSLTSNRVSSSIVARCKQVQGLTVAQCPWLCNIAFCFGKSCVHTFLVLGDIFLNSTCTDCSCGHPISLYFVNAKARLNLLEKCICHRNIFTN